MEEIEKKQKQTDEQTAHTSNAAYSDKKKTKKVAKVHMTPHQPGGSTCPNLCAAICNCICWLKLSSPNFPFPNTMCQKTEQMYLPNDIQNGLNNVYTNVTDNRRQTDHAMKKCAVIGKIA